MIDIQRHEGEYDSSAHSLWAADSTIVQGGCPNAEAQPPSTSSREAQVEFIQLSLALR